MGFSGNVAFANKQLSLAWREATMARLLRMQLLEHQNNPGHAYQSDLGWTAQALPAREPRMKIPRRGKSHTTTRPAAAKGLPGMNVENASPTTNIQAFRIVPSLTKMALITPKIRADIPPQTALSVTMQMRPTRIPQKQFRTNAIVIFCA